MKTTEEIVECLRAMHEGDPEEQHLEADNLLCEYLRAIGHSEVATAYEEARRRVEFWYA